MDLGVVTDAVKRYSGRKDKNPITLIQMAETFAVNKLLTNYLVVLL